MTDLYSIRIDKDTKDEFTAFCRSVGTSPGTAIRMFIVATLRERKLPFEVMSDPQGADDDS